MSVSTSRIEPILQTRGATLEERPIGRILVDMGKLKPADVDRVFALHRERGMRFGEAARSLRLVKEADVEHKVGLPRQAGAK